MSRMPLLTFDAGLNFGAHLCAHFSCGISVVLEAFAELLFEHFSNSLLHFARLKPACKSGVRERLPKTLPRGDILLVVVRSETIGVLELDFLLVSLRNDIHTQ